MERERSAHSSILLVFLVTALVPACAQLSQSRFQSFITDVHNGYRNAVNPPAANMREMVCISMYLCIKPILYMCACTIVASMHTVLSGPCNCMLRVKNKCTCIRSVCGYLVTHFCTCLCLCCLQGHEGPYVIRSIVATASLL